MLKQIRRVATVTLIGAATIVAYALPAFAHHIDVSVDTDCVDGGVLPEARINSQNGDYRFAGTATDSEGHAAAVSIPAGGGSTSVRLGPVTSSGQVHVVGDFWKENGDRAEHMDRTAEYPFLTDCDEESVPTPTTPPTTSPPTTKPPVTTTPPAKPPVKAPVKPKPVFHGTATNKKRAPAVHKAPPTVTKPKPAQPNQLPFTGAGEQAGMAAGGMLLVAGGAFLLRKGAQQA